MYAPVRSRPSTTNVSSWTLSMPVCRSDSISAGSLQVAPLRQTGDVRRRKRLARFVAPPPTDRSDTEMTAERNGALHQCGGKLVALAAHQHNVNQRLPCILARGASGPTTRPPPRAIRPGDGTRAHAHLRPSRCRGRSVARRAAARHGARSSSRGATTSGLPDRGMRQREHGDRRAPRGVTLQPH